VPLEAFRGHLVPHIYLQCAQAQREAFIPDPHCAGVLPYARQDLYGAFLLLGPFVISLFKNLFPR
jgi:hypothetical protein